MTERADAVLHGCAPTAVAVLLGVAGAACVSDGRCIETAHSCGLHAAEVQLLFNGANAPQPLLLRCHITSAH